MIIIYINYLRPDNIFIRLEPNSTIAGSARINAKKRDKKERQVRRVKKKKDIKGTEGKTPTRAIYALIGDEEQNEREKKKKETEQNPNPATPDHLVAPYCMHGSSVPLGPVCCGW